MRIALVSMGSPLKTDDDIANQVLDKLKGRDGLLKVRAEAVPENFIKPIQEFKPEVITFLDAVDFRGGVGEVRLFTLRDMTDIMVSTTHSLPIGIMGQFFPGVRIMVIGIQPKSIDYGTELSRELEFKMQDITREVEKLILRI